MYDFEAQWKHIPEQWKATRYGLAHGDRVRVVREYDHDIHSYCYRRHEGLVAHFSGATVLVDFSATGQTADPRLAVDAKHFTPAQLKKVYPELPLGMGRFVSVHWSFEEDATGFHIVTIDPLTMQKVQVAYCETLDNAAFVVGRLNRRF